MTIITKQVLDEALAAARALIEESGNRLVCIAVQNYLHARFQREAEGERVGYFSIHKLLQGIGFEAEVQHFLRIEYLCLNGVEWNDNEQEITAEDCASGERLQQLRFELIENLVLWNREREAA